MGTINEALRRPALRFLEHLNVIVPDSHAELWADLLLWSTQRPASRWASRRYAHLASHLTLRELHVGDPPGIRERPSGLYEGGRQQTRRYDYSSAGRTWPSAAALGQLRRRAGSSRLPRRLARDPHPPRREAGGPTADQRQSDCPDPRIWDASGKVQEAAFKTIVKLGARAEFVLDDLELLLQPPIGERDPRQAQSKPRGDRTRQCQAAAARARPRSRARHRDLRCVALLGWLRALGPAANPALALVDKLLASKPDEISSPVRGAAKSARKAMSK